MVSCLIIIPYKYTVTLKIVDCVVIISIIANGESFLKESVSGIFRVNAKALKFRNELNKLKHFFVSGFQNPIEQYAILPGPYLLN